MDITTVGVDLAKNVFTVCSQDRSGRTIERRDLRRDALRAWLARLPCGCVVGMEACSSAHYWAREMSALGLEPRIMAAEFVLPFRKSRVVDEVDRGGGPYKCWRCGMTSTNPSDMHLGHRNVPLSKGGNLSKENICLEGAACNLSAGNRGAPSPGMSCVERGSCGAPYGR